MRRKRALALQILYMNFHTVERNNIGNYAIFYGYYFYLSLANTDIL
jgi:hypothetical protein